MLPVSAILGFDPSSTTEVRPSTPPRRAGAAVVRPYRHVTGPSDAEKPPETKGPTASSTSYPSTPALQQPPLIGYPALSHFFASDKSFFVFRRFDELAARNLLYLQDELAALGEQLHVLDCQEHAPGDRMRNLRSRRSWDGEERRRKLMQEISGKLREYQKALRSQAAMLALERPSIDTRSSLRNWLDGNAPVVKEESHYPLTAEDTRNSDLCSLGGGEKNKDALERFIEHHWGVYFVGAKHRHRRKAIGDDHIIPYSSTRIRLMVRLLLTLTALLFLVAPVFALYFIRNRVISLVLVVLFSVGFAVAVAGGTKSRNVEIFTALAAYLAVLVAFLGSSRDR